MGGHALQQPEGLADGCCSVQRGRSLGLASAEIGTENALTTPHDLAASTKSIQLLVDQGVGTDALFLGVDVGGEHPAEQLSGAVNAADHPGLLGVGEDPRIPRH